MELYETLEIRFRGVRFDRDDPMTGDTGRRFTAFSSTVVIIIP